MYTHTYTSMYVCISLPPSLCLSYAFMEEGQTPDGEAVVGGNKDVSGKTRRFL